MLIGGLVVYDLRSVPMSSMAYQYSTYFKQDHYNNPNPSQDPLATRLYSLAYLFHRFEFSRHAFPVFGPLHLRLLTCVLSGYNSAIDDFLETIIRQVFKGLRCA